MRISFSGSCSKTVPSAREVFPIGPTTLLGLQIEADLL